MTSINADSEFTPGVYIKTWELEDFDTMEEAQKWLETHSDTHEIFINPLTGKNVWKLEDGMFTIFARTKK